MWLLVNLITLLFVIVLGENCDKFGTLLYEDLACKPIYANKNNKNACPIKYECPDFSKGSKSKCYYRGQSYNPGEIINEHRTQCKNPSCFSQREFNNNRYICVKLENVTTIICVGDACDGEFYHQHSNNHYHSCGNSFYAAEMRIKYHSFQSNSNPYPPSCKYKGIKYQYGQTFSLVNKCLDCTCGYGFNGTLEEPFCRRPACNIQLKSSSPDLKEYCAPSYGQVSEGEALCCPTSWVCPDGKETVKGTAKSNDFCRFGNKTVKVGQRIEKPTYLQNYYNCRCVIPPLLYCVEKTDKKQTEPSLPMY